MRLEFEAFRIPNPNRQTLYVGDAGRSKMKNVAESVSIQPITEAFLAGFRKLIGELAAEPLYVTAIEPPDEETLRVAVKNHIGERLPIVIAVDGDRDRDRVVGLCAIGPRPAPGLTHTGVLGIGLLEDYRRLGVGSRLLDAALMKARERDLTRIELEVLASNAPAIAFYEKHGFLVEGRKVKARLLEGRYDDVIIMARLFA